jgi:hypothetical protein
MRTGVPLKSGVVLLVARPGAHPLAETRLPWQRRCSLRTPPLLRRLAEWSESSLGLPEATRSDCRGDELTRKRPYLRDCLRLKAGPTGPLLDSWASGRAPHLKHLPALLGMGLETGPPPLPHKQQHFVTPPQKKKKKKAPPSSVLCDPGGRLKPKPQQPSTNTGMQKKGTRYAPQFDRVQ